MIDKKKDFGSFKVHNTFLFSVEPSNIPSPSVNAVIDSTPSSTTQTPVITPSKTVQPKETQKKISSVVQVQPNPPKVEKITNKPQIFSSKVEVVSNAPSSKVLTKVEIVTGPPVSSKVEILKPSTSKPFVVSSVVEVKSEEEPVLIGTFLLLSKIQLNFIT